jgi:hypothetical protein
MSAPRKAKVKPVMLPAWDDDGAAELKISKE